jgi:transcriptional regulator with XRE-family HTH domain
MTVAEPVSLRQAAKTIGMSPSTLSPLLRSEPTLQAAVVGRGARNSLKIDLEVLTAAWAALQGEPDQTPQNDRQRYRLERVRHLWWQVQGERARLAETEAGLVAAGDLEARQQMVEQLVRDGALEWLEEAAAIAPGLSASEAQVRLQELAHAGLVRLVEEHTSKATESALAPVSLTFPADDAPTLWGLRGDLEAVRAETRRVGLLVSRGALVDGAEAQRRLFERGRQLRDGWFRVAQNLGLRARLLSDADAFRAAAIQELTGAGLLG